MFGTRERYLRKFQTLSCFVASVLMLEHATSFMMMSLVWVFGVLLLCYLSSFQSVDDVEIPSADMQCELPISEFQVWSKVIRSCDLSLEEEAVGHQPAIEFSRIRVIERPWDVWIQKFICFTNQRINALKSRVCQLIERQLFGNALSVTNSILRVIESKLDLIRATFDREGASDGSTFDRTFIEREGVTFGLHFAPIQQPLQREGVTFGLHFAQIQPSQPTTLRGDTFLPTRTSKRTQMSLLYSRQSMSKLWNRILHLREGVLRKWSGGDCRMYVNL